MWTGDRGRREGGGRRKQGRKSRGNAFAAMIAALERKEREERERERERGEKGRQSPEKNGPPAQQHKASNTADADADDTWRQK